MQRSEGGYTFYDEPVSKEAYRAALYLMYADYLKSFKDLQEIQASCGEAAEYISTLDEIEVLLGHYREEIFFELERSEGFKNQKMYQIPKSLLEHPVLEERAFCRLTDEMSQIWKEIRRKKPGVMSAGAASDASGRLPTRSIPSRSPSRAKPTPGPKASVHERPSEPTYGYVGISRAQAQKDFAVALRVAGMVVLGTILMYGCAFSLAVSVL